MWAEVGSFFATIAPGALLAQTGRGEKMLTRLVTGLCAAGGGWPELRNYSSHGYP